MSFSDFVANAFQFTFAVACMLSLTTIQLKSSVSDNVNYV